MRITAEIVQNNPESKSDMVKLLEDFKNQSPIPYYEQASPKLNIVQSNTDGAPSLDYSGILGK